MARGRSNFVVGIIQVVKEIIGRVIVGFGLHRRFLRGKAIVVAFHSVTAMRSRDALRCSVEDFDSYCRFFSRHLNCQPFSQLIDSLGKAERLNGQVSVTFDDGYADNAELAMPVLNRRGIRALFYVTSGFVESSTQTFWDRDAKVESRWMTWPQVRTLVAHGHELGAHTVSHADLAKEPRERIVQELTDCRAHLGEHGGFRPVHLAIPFGRSFASIGEVVSLAKSMGFVSISLCRGGLVTEDSETGQIERWPIDANAYLSPYGWMVDVIREARSKPVRRAWTTS